MPNVIIKPPPGFLKTLTGSAGLTGLSKAGLHKYLVRDSKPRLLIQNAFDPEKRQEVLDFCSDQIKETTILIYTLSQFKEMIKKIDTDTPNQILIDNDYHGLFIPDNFFYSVLKNNTRYKIYYDDKYVKQLNPEKFIYIKPDDDTKNEKLDVLCFYCNSVLFMVNLYFYENYVQMSPARSDIPGRLFELFSGQKFPKRLIDKSKLTLGADPELLFYKKDQNGLPKYKNLMSAESTLRHRTNEVGTDACSELCEIRPLHGKNPDQITNNIRHRITSLANGYLPRKDIFVEAGGGCRRSIGGHIHLGHPDLKNNVDNCQALYTMLDDFLYFPIREQIHGGMRQWGLVWDKIDNPIDKDILRLLEKTEEVHKVIKSVSKSAKSGFRSGGYDNPGKYRRKEYGVEYRSLPSFIACPELTKLVFTLTQNITLKFFDIVNEEKNFMYRKPPKRKDYLNFLSAEETDLFFEYLEGDKQDVFLRNVLDSWGVEVPGTFPSSLLTINFRPFARSTLDRIARNVEFDTHINGERNIKVHSSSYIPRKKWYFDIITQRGNWHTFPEENTNYVNEILQNSDDILILCSNSTYKALTVGTLQYLVHFALQIDELKRNEGNIWKRARVRDMNYDMLETGFFALDINLRERTERI